MRAVYLDRDGVLNVAVWRGGKRSVPFTVDEFHICAGVRDALPLLKAAGYRLVVVTNQPDVARGAVAREQVDAVHSLLQKELPWLDEIRACFHDDSDECACRKPRPGMLIEDAARNAVRLDESFMVGDRWKDVEAGHRAGCRTVLITGEISEAEGEPTISPTHIAPDLLTATRWILAAGQT